MSEPSDRDERLINIVRTWADIYEGICKRSQHTKITAADFDPIAIVFQELEETITRPHGENVIYTMSVFEFNDDDKVRALRVYMQQAKDVDNVLILGTGRR